MPAGNYGHSIDLGKELEEENAQEPAAEQPPEQQPPAEPQAPEPATPPSDEQAPQDQAEPPAGEQATPEQPVPEQAPPPEQPQPTPEEEMHANEPDDEPPEEPARPPDPGEEDIIEIIGKDTPALGSRKTLADRIVALRLPILLVFVLLAGIVGWSVFHPQRGERVPPLPAENLPTGEAFLDDAELFPLFALEEPVVLEVNSSFLEQVPVAVEPPAPAVQRNKSAVLAQVLAEGLSG